MDLKSNGVGSFDDVMSPCEELKKDMVLVVDISFSWISPSISPPQIQPSHI